MTWSHQHAETLLGIALGLLISAPVSFYLSLYSGLIVARRARFEELRYELIRILQSLEWRPGSQTFQLNGHRPFEMMLISSDLISLGHSEAADEVGMVDKEVCDELNRTTDFLTSEQLEAKFSAWMRTIRTMKPNKWILLDPRPRLYRTVQYENESHQDDET
jgi:hypothetical protein